MRSELEAPESAVRKANSVPVEPDRADAAPDAPRLTKFQRSLVAKLCDWIRAELGGELSVGQDAIVRQIKAFYGLFLAFGGDSALYRATPSELPNLDARAELAKASKALRYLFRSLGLSFEATPAQRKAKMERNRLDRENEAVKSVVPAPQMASVSLSAEELAELETRAAALPQERVSALSELELSDRELLDMLRNEKP